MNKKRRVIYEIYFPSFCRDFKDLTEKIPYFVELGVTTLWLTPIHPSDNEHGYSVDSYFKIREQYGTLEDFDNFIKKAHENSLEVLLDLVLCHTGYHHKLFQESIEGKNDCYFWSDVQINNQWKYCYSNKKWYLAPWSEQMPQLNNQSEKVREMIESVIRFWLLEHKVDGFRLDAIIFASGDKIEFWKWFCNMVYSIKPNAYIVGEAWDSFEISDMYAKETGMKTFNFQEAGWVKNTVINKQHLVIDNNEERSVIFLDNHDQTRISVSFNHDINKIKQALEIMFSFKNNDICIYYGTEIGMGVHNGHVAPGGFGDFYSRTPMEWYDVEIQRKDSNSLFNYTKKLIKEYKNYNK